MARLARFVMPGITHHVTQRGHGRQQTFFSDEDYAAYRDLLASGEEGTLSDTLRRVESTGRPLGNSDFLDRVEQVLGRNPRPAKRGPRRKMAVN